jgi:rhodanese-related sulfurtransferase
MLLLAAVAATALSWALRGDRLPLPGDTTVYELELAAPLVQPDEALRLYDEGDVLFADTRAGTVGQSVIPGAFPLRQDSFDDDLLAVFDFVEAETPLLLYGDGSLGVTSSVAARLVERGYTDVRILAGGVAAWRNAGGEVRDGRAEDTP